MLASACDLGPRDLSAAHGPAVHLIASYPADGQGTRAAADADVHCDSPTPDCPVPTDVAIELRFDRFLLPGGGFTAGARLYTGSRANAVPLRAAYDVLERVIVLRPARRLMPRALYTVEVLPGADPNQGFWAYDGAPLEEAALPLRFGFTTGDGPRAETAGPGFPSDTCHTIATEVLGRCSSCHVEQQGDQSRPALHPPMGLNLSNGQALFETAIDHVAHQTEVGSIVGQGLRSPARFGAQMNLVDPGSPATSYLIYKLLPKAENFQLAPGETSCATGYHAPVLDGSCQPPDENERLRLRDWFVLGDPMPKGDSPEAALTHADLIRLAAWIARGAPCPKVE